MPDEKTSYKDSFNETWDDLKAARACVGPFVSPMGRGIVVKSGDEYDDGTTEYHHFLTHDADGRAMKIPKHFVQREHKPMKMKKGIPAVRSG